MTKFEIDDIVQLEEHMKTGPDIQDLFPYYPEDDSSIYMRIVEIDKDVDGNIIYWVSYDDPHWEVNNLCFFYENELKLA